MRYVGIKKLFRLLPLACGLAACGGGGSSSPPPVSGRSFNPNITSNPVPKATIISVYPTSNVITGMPSSSFALTGTNLMGVNFKLGENSCESNYLAMNGYSDIQLATIKCDVPVANGGTVNLSIRESTNGSDTSGIASFAISTVAANAVPTITSVSPLTAIKGSEISFALTGTYINSFNGNNASPGVTYGGVSLWCTPWVNDVNSDNTAGKLVNCRVPNASGNGNLKWYYNFGQNSLDFGTLTVTD